VSKADIPSDAPATTAKTRCGWATHKQMHMQYHDTEWGVPVHDDRKLFEFLVLEGAQAGLSWETILRKRDNYRRAFDGFDPAKVAQYTEADIERLLGDPGIIRNRRKIVGAVVNAQRFLEIQREFGSFDSYVWRFVGGKPRMNSFPPLAQLPATSPESDAMSADLRKRGFKFAGSTICYSFMQAVGMVNDHTVDCYRYAEV
jgi:DNA-3-methyladenine glycosylase I